MKYYSIHLVFACIFVFALQSLFPAVTDNFALIQSRALAEPWMFITSIFLHAGILHLMYNMFALALFGFILERIVGSRRFIMIFFVAGISASAASFLFYQASLGASGAIFGIFGTLAVIRPKMLIWFYGMPMPMFIAIFVWAAIDLLGLFYPSNVANAAHLAGLATGIIFGLKLRKQFAEKQSGQYRIDDSEFEYWEERWMNN